MADLRRLHVLQAVVEHRSITAAANALGYTPSAVSQQLATLERETGAALFQRLGRRVVPTRPGLLLYEAAQPLLRAATRVDAVAAAVSRSAAGVFRLGAVPDAAAAIIPLALSSIMRSLQGLAVDVHEASSHELIQMLEQGTIDAAVVDDFVDPGTESRGDEAALLMDLPLEVVTAHHPTQRPMSSDWWLYSAQTNRATLIHWVARSHPGARVRLGTSARAVLRFVEAGHGSTVASALQVTAARADVHRVDSAGLAVRHQVRLRAPRGHDDALIAAVASACRQAAAEVLPVPRRDAE